MRLKTVLDNLYACRSSRHLENDPLSFCHRYENPQDQEIVALIASSLAYGKVYSIKNSLEKALGVMTPSPRQFIEQFEPAPCLAALAGFKHRFNDGRDLCALFLAAKAMIEQEGSIGSYFMRFYDPEAEDLTTSLAELTAAIRYLDYSPVFGTNLIPADSYFPFFFPSPASGSACKRLCMFLRWMVRPADGIDLGLWKEISPAKLIIPVDAHIQKIARILGLTSRRQADWRMAKEITAALRLYDPEDPVKYDFSLCHIGISEGCSGRKREACLTCALSEVCGVYQE
jgi:uncharacterized protein (TIGR02757 family)